MAKKDNLSIAGKNIFPVIEKWLCSDHDIFYRELTSDDSDAITKLKELELTGEYERPEGLEYKIQVSMNPNDKTTEITDNGLGVAENEIDKYTNQATLSGAQGFMERYKDKANEDQIIGRFGLGFYSAFMVSNKVSIDSLSYQKDIKPVHWESEDGIGFKVEEGDKAEVGITTTLYLNEDSTGFCNEYRAREVIEKYRAFIPMDIFLGNETAEPQYETIEKDELTDKDTVVGTVIEPARTEEEEKGDGTKKTVEIGPSREKYKINRRPVVLNDTNSLWDKHPNGCSEKDYESFYRKMFRDYKEPLFWIHLNMDYPFNLEDTLYFPEINMEYDNLEGTIKLYNGQVFIAGNMKEVTPEFLMLLKGVIDCSDLPLSVSRSALQNNGFVKKISGYITKKVAGKLSGMCKADRKNYEKYWDDTTPFVRFGYIKDEKFAGKMGNFTPCKNLEDKYLTLQGCLDENKEKHENTIFYVTNEEERSRYISMFKEEGIDAVIIPAAIDSPFISYVEQKKEGLKFLRIDTDLNAAFKEEVGEDDEEFKKASEELTEYFKKALNNDKLDIKIEKMENAGVASMVTISEDTRRMQDMMKMYSMGGMDMGMFGDTGGTLVLNINHPLVQYVLGHKEDANTSKTYEQLYDLASLSHGPLAPERMTTFVSHSNKIMMIMAGEKTDSKKTEQSCITHGIITRTITKV